MKPVAEYSSENETAEARRGSNSFDDRLRLLIERIEALEEDKKNVSDDIRGVYAELKAVGYDVKVARDIVKARKADPNAWRERQTIFELYACALGLDLI